MVEQLHTANDKLVLGQGQGLVRVTEADVIEAAAAEATAPIPEQLPGCAIRQGPCCRTCRDGCSSKKGGEPEQLAQIWCLARTFEHLLQRSMPPAELQSVLHAF